MNQKFHQFLADDWEMRMQADPLFATYTGDNRFNDRLPDISEAYYENYLSALCGLETRRCALTYARNNPIKYVDPDGRANDWAYGPFSDNNPKTPIQWNSVTPQQKAVEGTLAAITTVAAVGPLIAVALPVVGLEGLGMALGNMSIGAAVGAASNENDPKNGASIGALAGLFTAGGGPASSATRGALASFLSQKAVGDNVNYAKVAWTGVIAGQMSFFFSAMKSAGVAMSGTAAQVLQSATTEMGLWMTGVDVGPYAPAKVEKKTPSDCPAAGSECKK